MRLNSTATADLNGNRLGGENRRERESVMRRKKKKIKAQRK